MTEKHFTWCPLPDILESWGKPDLGYNNFMIARWKDRKNIGSWWFSWWARTNMEAQIPLNFLHLKCNTFLSHCVLVAQSCLTLCNPVDCSLPGSSVHGILQARILQWVAISFSRGSSRLRDQTQVSCIADRFLLSESLTREAPLKPILGLNYASSFRKNKSTTSLKELLWELDELIQVKPWHKPSSHQIFNKRQL